MPGLRSLGVLSHSRVELYLFLSAVLTELKHGHSSNSSHMLVFTDGGKVQARQEIIPQMLNSVAVKGK